MHSIFGTDGIRSKANSGLMRANSLQNIAMAVGNLFIRKDRHAKVVIGKDTRLSGYMVETALTSGFLAVGMDVMLVGPLPTPAIAMLTTSMRAAVGVMISASHNPYDDNGIKLFGHDGYKLSIDMEEKITKYLSTDYDKMAVSSAALGKAKRLDDAPGRYIEKVKQTFPIGMTLEGLKIVVDCANGASYHLAPTILSELGATVIPVAITPNGFNINDNCGSNFPENLAKHTIENGADIGVAFDGDADRFICCDEKGKVADGNQILAIIAEHWQEEKKLMGGSIVSTILANKALEDHCRNIEVELLRTNVGDKYISNLMRKNKIMLGGEPSGHLIFACHSTTGDGLVAALQILSVLVAKQKPASEILHPLDLIPQTTANIAIGSVDIDYDKYIKQANDILGNKGRVIIRPSGTEPLLRIMVETHDTKLAKEIIDIITKDCVKSQ